MAASVKARVNLGRVLNDAGLYEDALKAADEAIAIDPDDAPASNVRWIVCALLFFATTINYIDRQILALIKEFLDHELRWTNEQFGLVNSAYNLSHHDSPHKQRPSQG